MTELPNAVFQKFTTSRRLSTRQQGDGHEVEVEVREDEEQSVKLQEIIDLLVAAGYFRARIKGLSSFDKVVGGMTWCIESCNVDVDVDLLFQENSTIGQKIALTEKIVNVLPKMKCPHSIEPHQIQGLDFIHIFPVIQWLVKRSVEFRQEMSELVRSYAVKQFVKNFGVERKMESNVIKNVLAVKEFYRPVRYFRQKNSPSADFSTQVQITLLEYGSVPHVSEQSNTPKILEEQIIQQDPIDHDELSPEDMKNLSDHYAALQVELKDGGIKVHEGKRLSTLEEQVQALDERCQQLDQERLSLEEAIKNDSLQLKNIRLKQQKVNIKLEELQQNVENENVKEVEELVSLNENLKMQETQFRNYCKSEITKLHTLIEQTKKEESPVESTEEIDKQICRLVEAIKSLRLQLARKNRTVVAIQRQLDDVPNRPELAQYQRRFLELYNQVSAKHKETKQYYTLYNTLEDTRRYMTKELSLLNSISDSYPEAVLSNSNKDEFMQQFQAIMEGVNQSKQKVEKRLEDEKRKRDHLSSTMQSLIEQQRKYVTVVRQLHLECRKYETLSVQNNN